MTKVTISTHKGELLSEDAVFFLVHSEDGEYAILDQHIPVVSIVDRGYVKIRTAQKEQYVAIVGGVVEQSDNNITVFAQEAAVADSFTEALSKLDEMHAKQVEENKKIEQEFAVSERDLQKAIKAAKAGEFV